MCERERECVCVCVFVGVKNERERKESMGERDVATETGGNLSASSKQRTTGHTLMLGMDSQTIVCLIILCLLCTFLGRQGSSPTEYHCVQVQYPSVPCG